MEQASANSNVYTQIITPFARRLLRISGCICSVYVLFVFAKDGALNFLWGALLVGIGLFSLFLSTRPARRYYTPLILTIFFFLGYLISLCYILLDKEKFLVSDYHNIGNFRFTDSGFFPAVIVICAGTAGIITATLMAEKIFRRKNVIASIRRIDSGLFSQKKLWMWIWLWFGFSVCLVLLMWSMEIGKTGLKEKIQLPFKVAGIAVFLRKIVVPFVGILLLDFCLRVNKKKWVILVLIFLLILAVLGSLGSLSRHLFAFTAFPPILFLLFRSRNNNFSQKVFFKFLVIGVITCVYIIPLIRILRNVGFEGENLRIVDSLETLRAFTGYDFLRDISEFISLATLRVGGMGELLAVATSGVAEVEIPFRLFVSDQLLYRDVCYSVYGFTPISSDIVGFGKSFCMWGQLFLSGSYLVVYLGTFLLVGTVICFEEIFIRIGVHSAALLFSTLLGYAFWGGSASAFLLSRYFAMLVLCYLLMLVFLKTLQVRLRKGSQTA